MTIRAPKDFWSGIMFIAFAAVGMIAARGYSLGGAGHMGPGYFPLLLGIVLALIGVILLARSFAIDGDGVGTISVRPLAVVTLGVVVFGALIESLGLVISLVAVTMLSAAAGRQSRPIEAAALAAAMAALSVAIFSYALRLPIPVWPAF